ncbi:MAG: tRNA preQ1(34) S-adenosylmethionine ribosyltransferase-isomerase QueA [Planctomycetota bacterium]
MTLDDYDYDLPEELIAQQPAAERGDARLLVHAVREARTAHQQVRDLPRWLEPGDLVVFNDTRVRRARLEGRRPGGGRVELLLVERRVGVEPRWLAMARPASRLRPGMELALPANARAIALEREVGSDGQLGPGWWIELVLPPGIDEEDWIEAHGSLPLPPYVQRPDGERPDDGERYQTVFARERGAVAAPTAGLHFDRALIDRLSAGGVEFANVTLHVGPGTFRPVEVDDPRQHRMHSERFVLPAETAAAIDAARARGGRVVAIGTTSARTLESCHVGQGRVAAREGATELFLYPGIELEVVDALLTNFHLPRSTLLMLVSAFIGRERTLDLYREAVKRRYRFYSYGDAMLLIHPRSGRT